MISKDPFQPFSFRKTRLAPTPSGFLHLGNILSFAITATLAEKNNASILLRIDDLDMVRTQPAFVQDIFDTLQFLEIPWHEGPRNVSEYEKQFSQMHRMDMYRKALEQLATSGAVFACTCSRKQVNEDGGYPGTCRNKLLSLKTADSSWRLFTGAEALSIKNMDGSVTHSKLPASVYDFVVRKKDGYPAYQLTSLLDDAFYGIDGIVRGEDLWPSTIAQHYLANRLGITSFGNTVFLHHGLLLQQDGEKLSKSAGSTSVQYLRGEGRSPADIYSIAGRMAGIATPVADWRMLGEALLYR